MELNIMCAVHASNCLPIMTILLRSLLLSAESPPAQSELLTAEWVRDRDNVLARNECPKASRFEVGVAS